MIQTTNGGFWIICNHCSKMFDNQDNYRNSLENLIAGCSDTGYNFDSMITDYCYIKLYTRGQHIYFYIL